MNPLCSWPAFTINSLFTMKKSRNYLDSLLPKGTITKSTKLQYKCMCPIFRGGRGKTDRGLSGTPTKIPRHKATNFKDPKASSCNSSSQAQSSNKRTFAFLLHILPSSSLKKRGGLIILAAEPEFTQTHMKPANNTPIKCIKKLRDWNNSPPRASPKSHRKATVEPEIEPRPPDSKPWALTKTPASLHQPSPYTLH